LRTAAADAFGETEGFERLEPRRRRHYSPRQRFRVLLFMKTMSVAETARRFLASTQTLARWMKEASLCSEHRGRDAQRLLAEFRA
jgi:hypothetical protein